VIAVETLQGALQRSALVLINNILTRSECRGVMLYFVAITFYYYWQSGDRIVQHEGSSGSTAAIAFRNGWV
jgi:hypothetical protein